MRVTEYPETDTIYPDDVLLIDGKKGTGRINASRAGLAVSYSDNYAHDKHIYRGENLGSFLTDEQKEHIKDGSFKDLYVGDYFDIKLKDGKTFRYRIAHIDPYLHCADQEITQHHMIMVPDQVWPDSVLWNTTNTNNGTAADNHPYTASNLHKWEIGTFLPLMPDEWQAVMVNHRKLLEERFKSGSSLTESTAWSWVDVGKIFSLSETEVYGHHVWGGSYSVGYDCKLDLFTDTASRIRRNHNGERYNWLLCGVRSGSSARICAFDHYGAADHRDATNTGIRPLPCFCAAI